MADFAYWDSGHKCWKAIVVVHKAANHEIVYGDSEGEVLKKMVRRYPKYTSMTIELS